MGSRSPSRLARAVRAIAALAILATGTPALSQAPQQPGTVKANHGAWSIVCDQPAARMASAAIARTVRARREGEREPMNTSKSRIIRAILE